jgi:cytochrome c oxidase cbb3-type subunit I/II
MDAGETHGMTNKHRWLERRPIQFALVAFVAVAIGGAIEIIPTIVVKSNIPTITSVRPYTPLEVQGRDIYVREGCNTCHSQMIRPFRFETERYGEYSKAGEFVYDHPFLWGSKRTGPDLHRVGGKYSNLWHYLHMQDPISMSPGSIMPRYPWLLEDPLDVSTTPTKISALRTIGVPYPQGYEEQAVTDLTLQAENIAKDLQAQGVPSEPDKEIIALIAYLQRLGTDIKGAQK